MEQIIRVLVRVEEQQVQREVMPSLQRAVLVALEKSIPNLRLLAVVLLAGSLVVVVGGRMAGLVEAFKMAAVGLAVEIVRLAQARLIPVAAVGPAVIQHIKLAALAAPAA